MQSLAMQRAWPWPEAFFFLLFSPLAYNFDGVSDHKKIFLSYKQILSNTTAKQLYPVGYTCVELA
jgi:hypothetical protein